MTDAPAEGIGIYQCLREMRAGFWRITEEVKRYCVGRIDLLLLLRNRGERRGAEIMAF